MYTEVWDSRKMSKKKHVYVKGFSFVARPYLGGGLDTLECTIILKKYQVSRVRSTCCISSLAISISFGNYPLTSRIYLRATKN